MALRIIITAPTPPFLMETLTQKGYEVMYEPTISFGRTQTLNIF